MEEIVAPLTEYITKTILKNPKRTLRLDEPLISSGLIDSFHLVDLGLFIESRFGVRLDDAELSAQTFDTLAQLAALIQQRRNA